MLIDCDRCAMQGLACGDCVVTALFDAPSPSELDERERRALRVLAEADMVAPLRLVSDSEVS